MLKNKEVKQMKNNKNNGQKGWFERKQLTPDGDEKAIEHVMAANKNKTKDILRQPMVKEPDPEQDEKLQATFRAKKCKLEALDEFVESHGLELSVAEGEEEGTLKAIAQNEKQLTELQAFLSEEQILEDESESDESEDESGEEED